MKMSPVSFGNGLLMYKGQYIVPEQVIKFIPNNKENTETRVIYNNSKNDLIPVSTDYFAAAWINAKNSNDILSLEK